MRIIALLRHALHGTVLKVVLYSVVTSRDEDTAATELLLGLMNTVDSRVVVIVEVTSKVRVLVSLPTINVEVSEQTVVMTVELVGTGVFAH